VFCWLIYGIFTGLYHIIIANFITLLLAGAILVMKLRNLRQENDPK
jgi:MtN3 and saliva related transmembrane protein